MKLSILKVIFLLISCCLYGQSQEEMIKDIREHFNFVERSLDSFQVREELTFEESTDGATIKKYYDNDELVKVRIEYLGETGKLYREFYIDNLQLLFVFDQEFKYNMPYYMDAKKANEMGFDEAYDPNKTKKHEHRYYFYNNKLIRWINPEGEHQTSANSQWVEKQKFYLNELLNLK
ncbi:hypothetical protein E1176_06810 [Fulvivirga sp. RKSG066]|uniref:hypothetical protein n=1 Tax=Fulvivirga aurantia TaxID=2529383 RepID=UPI0012BBD780|nr:hypothetical protein [Fulvivirga aurantia]MTI20726.1 hypothetical protein [Fulvivirga aurantia]